MRCFLDAHVHIARKVIVYNGASAVHVDAAEFLDSFCVSCPIFVCLHFIRLSCTLCSTRWSLLVGRSVQASFLGEKEPSTSLL